MLKVCSIDDLQVNISSTKLQQLRMSVGAKHSIVPTILVVGILHHSIFKQPPTSTSNRPVWGCGLFLPPRFTLFHFGLPISCKMIVLSRAKLGSSFKLWSATCLQGLVQSPWLIFSILPHQRSRAKHKTYSQYVYRPNYHAKLMIFITRWRASTHPIILILKCWQLYIVYVLYNNKTIPAFMSYLNLCIIMVNYKGENQDFCQKIPFHQSSWTSTCLPKEWWYVLTYYKNSPAKQTGPLLCENL